MRLCKISHPAEITRIFTELPVARKKNQAVAATVLIKTIGMYKGISFMTINFAVQKKSRNNYVFLSNDKNYIHNHFF